MTQPSREKKKQAGLLRQFAGYYKPHWKLFAADMLRYPLSRGGGSGVSHGVPA